MIGLDTGFFIKLLAGNETAKNYWIDIVNGQRKAVVSTLTLFELKRLTLKGMIDKEAFKSLDKAIPLNCKLIEVDKKLCIEATNISYGLKLAAMDALIFTTFRLAGCTEVLTTDSKWTSYKEKKPEVKVI